MAWCTYAQVSDTEIYLVVNAGNREKDINHIKKHLAKFDVSTASLRLALAMYGWWSEKMLLFPACVCQCTVQGLAAGCVTKAQLLRQLGLVGHAGRR